MPSSLLQGVKWESLSTQDKIAFVAHGEWLSKAHHYQIPPPMGMDWYVWMLLAGRGAGKGLTLNTPIPTPDGWKMNGDIKNGDAIFDELGRVCHVVIAHEPYTPKTLYRLTFSDGSSIDADGEHLWATWTHRSRKQYMRYGSKNVFPCDWATYSGSLFDCHGNVTGKYGISVGNTESIIDSLNHSSRKDTNHCIPNSLPLLLPMIDLPIDPYLLGSWLGDGSSMDQIIHGHIDDINHITSHVLGLGYEIKLKHDKKNTWNLRIYGLAKELKAIGVFGNKHVPLIYMRSSVKQRLVLLRGLMDTDGYQSGKGAEFCNTNRNLAESVYELAVSLGERPVFKEGRAMLYGRDCGAKYRVTWRWSLYNPFSMPRKANVLQAPKAQALRFRHRMIKRIEVIPTETVRCLTVDSQSAMYLAGKQMIPTHNTAAAAEGLWWWTWRHKWRSLVLAPTSNDLKHTCFEGQSGLLSVIPSKLIHSYNKQDHQIILLNGASIRGISADSYERLRGPQFHAAWCFGALTLILMSDGTKKQIKNVRVGDYVMTRFGERKVLSSGLSNNPSQIVRVMFGASSLAGTQDHPILVGGSWIPMGKLKKGDLLWQASFTTEEVGDLIKTDTTSIPVSNVQDLPWEPTYNLTVEGEHEFIANGIVVHNCDELAAFNYLGEGQAWDMMNMGLRLGESPRVIVTTTPRNKELILELIDREGDDVIIDRATTYANIKNLSKTFSKQLERYKGGKLYDQEVLGQVIDLETGKVVSRSMFRLWPHSKPFPKFEYIIQSYDCAFTDKLYNDPTAMTTWGVFKPLDGPMSILLIDCWEEHLTFPNLKPKVIEEFSVVYGEGIDAKRPDLILVEDKAAGISLIQELQKAYLPVRGWNPGKADKMQRLQITASVFSAGRVWLPENKTKPGYVRDWAEGMLSQLCSFPDSTRDDYVDSTTQAIRFLSDTGWIEINTPTYDPDDYNDENISKTNPYAV